jgi:hypothetical protein
MTPKFSDHHPRTQFLVSATASALGIGCRNLRERR